MVNLSRLACAVAFAIGFSLPALADNHRVAMHGSHGGDPGAALHQAPATSAAAPQSAAPLSPPVQ
jgi:hypothetical protein